MSSSTSPAPLPTSAAAAAAASTPRSGASQRARRGSGRSGRRRSGRRRPSAACQHQGVLYKRRDVFKKRWRPRLFVLDVESGVLTYYLLNNEHDYKPTAAAGSRRREDSIDELGAESSSSLHGVGGAIGTRSRADTGSSFASGGGGAVGGNRSRSWTDDSHLSSSGGGGGGGGGGGDARSVATGVYSSIDDLDATYDFDVVPRGSYYLPGCAVATDDRNSKPGEGLFAFTILLGAEPDGGASGEPGGGGAEQGNNSGGGAPIHLAASSELERATWVRRIAEACCRLSAHGAVARGAEKAARDAAREERRRDRAAAEKASEASSAAEEKAVNAVGGAEATKAAVGLATGSGAGPDRDDNAGVGDRDNDDNDDASSISTKSSIGERDLRDEEAEGAGDDAGADQEAKARAAVVGPQEQEGADNSEGGNVESALDGIPMVPREATPAAPGDGDHPGATAPMASASDEGPAQEGLSADDEEEAADIGAPPPGSEPLVVAPAPPSAPVTSSAPRERTWSRGTAATGTSLTTFATSDGDAESTPSAPAAPPPTAVPDVAPSLEPTQPSRLPAVKVYAVVLIALSAADALYLYSEAHLISVLLVKPTVTALLLLVGPMAMRGLCEDLETSVAVRGRRRRRARRRKKKSRKGEGGGDGADRVGGGDAGAGEALSLLPLSQSAAVLFLPPLLWAVGRSVSAPLAEALFVALALYGVRTLVALSLGEPLVPSSSSSAASAKGTVTCRFAVDLRGVLRYIRNKREERLELRRRPADGSEPQRPEDVPAADVSVTHIAVRAVALALSESSPGALNSRRVSVPLLGIGGYYPNGSGNGDGDGDGVSVAVAVAVSASSSAGTSPQSVPGASRMAAVRRADEMSAQGIADFLRREQRGQNIPPSTTNLGRRGALEGKGPFSTAVRWFRALLSAIGLLPADSSAGPRCVCTVFTSPDSENSQVDVDVAPPPDGQPGIVVVVGGVRSGGGAAAGGGRDGQQQDPRPMLSVSVSIDCPPASVAECRRFAEKVQRLMQFPELCDEVA